MSDSGTIYPSKKDLWLVIVMVLTILLVLFAGYDALQADGDPLVRYAVAVTCLLIAGFCIWLLAGTRYVLNREEIRIFCGPIRMRVRLADIKEIYPTHNPLSSPALSLDRLRIDTGKWPNVMISPQDKEGFLRRLRLLDTDLRPTEKGGLERRPRKEGELLDVDAD